MNRGDLVGVLDSIGIFNLSDQHDLFVGSAHFRNEVPSAIAVMGDAKGNTAAAFWRIFGATDDFTSLFFARDEGDDDAHRACVQDTGDEMIFQGGHADDRHDIGVAEVASSMRMVSMLQPVCSMSNTAKSAPASATMRAIPVVLNSSIIVPIVTPPCSKTHLPCWPSSGFFPRMQAGISFVS